MGLKVFNFICENGHTFEAMVSGTEEFERQKKRGLFTCPICNTKKVSRALSAPHVQAASSAKARPSNTVEELNSVYNSIKKVLDQSEFVGDRFAEEARSIHKGESPERVITGTPTSSEVEELLDEGIGVLPLGIKTKKHVN